jgi:GDPmannose 4,6-dehydratase
MMQQDAPDDYVISTGVTHTVREFLEESLLFAGLNGAVEEYVDFDKEMIRPAEVDLLVGDSSKAKKALNWRPAINFKELVGIMVENDLKLESKN